MFGIVKFVARPLVSIALVLTLAACGDGANTTNSAETNPQIGVFKGSPASGMSYTSGTIEGIVALDDSFSYIPGKKTEFKVGNVTVGSLDAVPADGVVTPHDLVGTTRANHRHPNSTVIAQFLQSIANTPSVSPAASVAAGSRLNVQTVAIAQLPQSTSATPAISPSVHTALSSVPPVALDDSSTVMTQPALSSLVQSATNSTKSLVPTAQAQGVMARSLNEHFSAMNFPCSPEQMLNFKRDVQAFVGVINSVTIGTTALAADVTNLTNPVSPSTTLGPVVGVISDVYFWGGQTQPLDFGFLVSNANQVTLTGLLDEGLSNIDVQISFTVYYYDPVAKVYYTDFWTSNSTVQGLIQKAGEELNLGVDVTPYPGIDQPLLYPVRLGVAPMPNLVQKLYRQYSNTTKTVIDWGVSVSGLN